MVFTLSGAVAESRIRLKWPQNRSWSKIILGEYILKPFVYVEIYAFLAHTPQLYFLGKMAGERGFFRR
jgi:hypothetical protein